MQSSGDRAVTRMMLGLVISAGLFMSVNGKIMLREPNQQRAYRSPFRYVIFNNEVDAGYRYLEVLLDEKAFSEENLKQLFKLVSNRFPIPRVLHIQVYTNLEDAETPEERESGKASEQPGNPAADRYHSAYFLRDNDGNQWFTYNPDAPDTKLRTVVVKGQAPPYPAKSESKRQPNRRKL